MLGAPAAMEGPRGNESIGRRESRSLRASTAHVHPCLAALLHWPLKEQAQRGPTRHMRTFPHILQRKQWGKVPFQQCCTETVTGSSAALYLCVRGFHFDPNPGVSGWGGSQRGAKAQQMDDLLGQLLELVTSPD